MQNKLMKKTRALALLVAPMLATPVFAADAVSAVASASASASAPAASAPVGQASAVTLDRGNFQLAGTLLLPQSGQATWVALLIAGSGPTDRDGNVPGMKVDTLRLVAEGLARAGIASVRYDKRGIGGSAIPGLKESTMRFTDFSDDATAWAEWLRKDRRFARVAVIGHSEGAMHALLVAQRAPVDAMVSLEGPSRDLLTMLGGQLKVQFGPVQEIWQPTEQVIASLRRGETTTELPGFGPLQSVFRPSVQPFLISAAQVDPSREIAKLKVPVAIVQGGTDVQVTPADGQRLAAAKPDATYREFPEMNHAMKDGRKGDMMAYIDPAKGLSEGVVAFVTEFLGKVGETKR